MEEINRKLDMIDKPRPWKVLSFTRGQYVRQLIKRGWSREKIIRQLKEIRRRRIAFRPVVNRTIYGIELHL